MFRCDPNVAFLAEQQKSGFLVLEVERRGAHLLILRPTTGIDCSGSNDKHIGGWSDPTPTEAAAAARIRAAFPNDQLILVPKW